MALQNRVTPFGEIVATEARGSLMGNRGCLHDDRRQLGRRRWTTKAWVACLLAFKDRPPRRLMQPGHYAELFFLDEATALSAGHRPCAQCRYAAYRRFAEAWAAGANRTGERVSAAEMDRAIHAERVDGARGSRTFAASLADLPDGTMIAMDGTAYLKQADALRPWSLSGYGPPLGAPVSEASVTVLTPRPIVEAIRAGYRTDVHATAHATALS